MTNPNNMVRVRARNGGRASVYEANGWAQAYSIGLVEGNGVTQNTSADMNVLVGGSATKPDVVLATNPAGYKIALDLVSQQAVAITAPASNKRISAIVAYTDDLSLATTQDTVTGSPASCGLIVVNGTASSSPSVPSDATIRSAITSDGATGSQAAYCIVAIVLVASGTSAITNSEITVNRAAIGTNAITDNAVTSGKIDFATFADYSLTEVDTHIKWVNGKTIYKKTINIGTLPNATNKAVNHGISDIERIIEMKGYAYYPGTQVTYPIPFVSKNDVSFDIGITANKTSVEVSTGIDRTMLTECYVTIYYTKN